MKCCKYDMQDIERDVYMIFIRDAGYGIRDFKIDDLVKIDSFRISFS